MGKSHPDFNRVIQTSAASLQHYHYLGVERQADEYRLALKKIDVLLDEIMLGHADMGVLAQIAGIIQDAFKRGAEYVRL